LNRFRKEKGHLFQGGFKSLIVEPGGHLCDLVDCIHLNPARAKLLEPAGIGSYRWSGLCWMPKVNSRPAALDASWLDWREGVSDTRAGWRSYAASLQMRLSDNPKEILAKKETLRLEKEGLADLNEAHWEGAFEKCLATLRQSEAAAKATAKSASWKLAVAAKLESQTSVRNKRLRAH